MKEIFIHGFKVKFEEDVRWGVNYLLYDLDYEESRVFFDQAKLRGFAKFEDDQDRQYTLIYNSDGSYTLIKRDR